MEMTSGPNVSCVETCKLCSDLIDLRRGETPHPDGTPLSQPALRAAVEAHLASCPACQAELAALEEVGAAFANFTVGEVQAQHFADAAQKTRARLARGSAGSPARRRRLFAQKSFWVATASSCLAAAACLLLVFHFGFMQPTLEITQSAAVVPPAKKWLTPRTFKNIEPINYIRSSPSGVETVPMQYPPEPKKLKRMLQDEIRLSHLVFPEQLLGAALKTTRGSDRVSNEGPPIGLAVEAVAPAGPASKMGVHRGDYIVDLRYTDVGGIVQELPINDGGAEEAVEFLAAIKALGSGAQFELKVIRPEGSQWLMLKPMVGVLGDYQ